MSFIDCPHCGAENFTMEGWEDLDHCASCGKPLGKPTSRSPRAADYTVRRGGAGRGGFLGNKGQRAERPRRA